MNEESIGKLRNWFDSEERRFDTGYTEDGVYYISRYDFNDFYDYLQKNEPTLLGISCIVGGIFNVQFSSEDLINAMYLHH